MSRCSGACLRRGPKCCDGRMMSGCVKLLGTPASCRFASIAIRLLLEEGRLRRNSDYYARGSTRVVVRHHGVGNLQGALCPQGAHQNRRSGLVASRDVSGSITHGVSAPAVGPALAVPRIISRRAIASPGAMGSQKVKPRARSVAASAASIPTPCTCSMATQVPSKVPSPPGTQASVATIDATTKLAKTTAGG